MTRSPAEPEAEAARANSAAGAKALELAALTAAGPASVVMAAVFKLRP